jgi:hypothetical protein
MVRRAVSDQSERKRTAPLAKGRAKHGSEPEAFSQTLADWKVPKELNRRGPVTAAVVAGSAGLALAAASLIGAVEVALVGAAGYLAYQWLKPRRPEGSAEPRPGNYLKH